MQILSYEELSKREKELVDNAQNALELAYNPYGSQTIVGAAVRDSSSKIIRGGCFGNDSSTSNICAERSVAIAANNQGCRDIEEMAVIGFSKNASSDKIFTPCGICRQVILEITKITGKDVVIFCSSQDKKKIMKTSIFELLPHSY